MKKIIAIASTALITLLGLNSCGQNNGTAYQNVSTTPINNGINTANANQYGAQNQYGKTKTPNTTTRAS